MQRQQPHHTIGSQLRDIGTRLGALIVIAAVVVGLAAYAVWLIG